MADDMQNLEGSRYPQEAATSPAHTQAGTAEPTSPKSLLRLLVFFNERVQKPLHSPGGSSSERQQTLLLRLNECYDLIFVLRCEGNLVNADRIADHQLTREAVESLQKMLEEMNQVMDILGDLAAEDSDAVCVKYYFMWAEAIWQWLLDYKQPESPPR